MKNKLNGRDFITIGIFNAISIVIYMAVAFALATTVVGGFIASGVAFMVAAISYLLMGVKIKKRGVFTISGTLLGLIALSGGHIPHAIFAILLLEIMKTKEEQLQDMGYLLYLIF